MEQWGWRKETKIQIHPPIERKRSSGQLLSGLGKGLGRMGSVMRRNTSESVNEVLSKSWKGKETVQEEAEDDDGGDADIGRPFNTEHELHVSPSLEDLPPEWLEQLRKQGLSEQDFMLISAARKQTQQAIRPLKSPVPPPSLPRLSIEERPQGMSIPTDSTEFSASAESPVSLECEEPDKKRLSDDLKSFGQLDLGDEGWAASLLSAMGEQDTSKLTVQPTPVRSRLSVPSASVPIEKTKRPSTSEGRQIKRVPIPPLLPPSAPRRSVFKPETVLSAKFHPPLPPPPKQSPKPVQAPLPPQPTEPNRTSSESFGVHYSTSKSSLDLVTPSTSQNNDVTLSSDEELESSESELSFGGALTSARYTFAKDTGVEESISPAKPRNPHMSFPASVISRSSRPSTPEFFPPFNPDPDLMAKLEANRDTSGSSINEAKAAHARTLGKLWGKEEPPSRYTDRMRQSRPPPLPPKDFSFKGDAPLTDESDFSALDALEDAARRIADLE